MTTDFYKHENNFIRALRHHPEFIQKALGSLSGNPMKDNPLIAGLFKRAWDDCLRQTIDKSGLYYEKYVLVDQDTKQKSFMWTSEVFLKRIIDSYPDVTAMPEYEHWGPVVEVYKLFQAASS